MRYLLLLSHLVLTTTRNFENFNPPFNRKILFLQPGKKVPPWLQRLTFIGLIAILTINCEVDIQYTPIDSPDDTSSDHSPDIHYGLPVLPNVSGFGLNTVGGKGGQIIKVTNLDKQGPGSLKEAIETSGPRIIVFEVGGVIDLEGEANLVVREPYVTIAGQTAPSPGITIIRGGLRINHVHEVIVQHITVRTGEAGHAKQSGWNRDAISTWNAHDVIIDHCTATWGTDENLSVAGSWSSGDTPEEWQQNTSHRVTVSNCISAHGLDNSTHSKGSHSMGTLIADGTNEILFYGNLWAHNKRRNPFVKANCDRIVIANNYIYNYGVVAIHTEYNVNQWGPIYPPFSVIAIEGNKLEPGPSTANSYHISFYGGADVYIHDTEGEIHWDEGEPTWFDERPFWPEGLIARPSSEVKYWVLENAGSRPWDRDPLTVQLIDDIKAGGGRIIDSEAEVGGYPSYTPTYREFNIDDWDMETMTKKNGMP